VNIMCKKTNYKTSNPRVDKCMRDCISALEAMSHRSSYIRVVACCCGHGKYPRTIVMGNSAGTRWELLTGIMIPRKRKFYKRDSEGYYYIPECSM